MSPQERFALALLAFVWVAILLQWITTAPPEPPAAAEAAQQGEEQGEERTRPPQALRATFFGESTAEGLLTAFLGHDPVPADAVFHHGAAFRQDGALFLADWPDDDAVVYVGGFARRHDGALVVATAAQAAAFVGGVGVTQRGEVIAAQDTPEVFHNGVPLKANGTLCCTEVA